jgi:hypothetical protein
MKKEAKAWLKNEIIFAADKLTAERKLNFHNYFTVLLTSLWLRNEKLIN